jgi:ATP-dependent DNA helicase PIF1
VVLLKKNHRQSKDPTYAKILELIRKGAGSDAGGNSRWVGDASILTHLRQRVLQQVSHHSPHALEAFRDAPVIVGSKRLRDLLNVRLIQSHAARTGKEVHLYYSRDTVRRRDITIEWVRNHLWNLPSRRTRDSFGFLPLFVGMKIMITENIAVPHKRGGRRCGANILHRREGWSSVR